MDGSTPPPDGVVAVDAAIDSATFDAPVQDAPSNTGVMDAADAGVAQLVVSTDTIDFGAVKIGDRATQLVTIQNEGTAAAIVSVTVTGDRQISTTSNGCLVRPGSMCQMSFHFVTYSIGESTASIKLTSGSWEHVMSARGESATALHLTKWGGGGITAPNLDCPLGCDTTFAKDITITAVPTSGNEFVAWSDPSCGTQPTCTVHQEAAGRYVQAYFAPASTTRLSLAVTGAHVRVEEMDFGTHLIATCSSHCSVPIPLGVPIRVSASSLSNVTGISGACTGTRSCTFTSTASTSIAVSVSTDPKERWVRELETPTVLAAAYDSHGNLIVVTDGYSPPGAGSGVGTSGDVIKLDPNGKTIWAHPNETGQEIRIGGNDAVYVRAGDTARILDEDGYEVAATFWSDVQSSYRVPYFMRRLALTSTDQEIMVGDPTYGATNVRSALAMWTRVINAASMNVLRATAAAIYVGVANSGGGFDIAVLDHTGAILTPITDAAPHAGMFELLPGGDIITASATTSEIAIRRKSGSTTTFTRSMPVQYSNVPNVAATFASNDRTFWVGPGVAPFQVAANGYYVELLSPTGVPVWSLRRAIPVEIYDLTSNGTDVAIVGTYSDATTGAGGSSLSGVVFGEGFVQTFRP